MILSVQVGLFVASLPPNCHRTRPKDAKTRPRRPGHQPPFLASLSGEGGIRTPGTACWPPIGRGQASPPPAFVSVAYWLARSPCRVLKGQPSQSRGHLLQLPDLFLDLPDS